MEGKLKAIDLTWHHVFNQQIRAGLIRDLGGNEYCVLSVIKAYININSGSTIGPTREQIADLTGFSISTVKRSLANLHKLKKIRKIQIGRTRGYRIVETLKVRNSCGTEKHAEFDYVPRQGNKISDEIKKYLTDGHPTQIVNIINIQINDNSIQINVDGGKRTKNHKEYIDQIHQALGKRARQ